MNYRYYKNEIVLVGSKDGGGDRGCYDNGSGGDGCDGRCIGDGGDVEWWWR